MVIIIESTRPQDRYCHYHRVQVLNADLTFSHMLIGIRGFGYGYLNSPFGVAFDSKGLVYVADTINHQSYPAVHS